MAILGALGDLVLALSADTAKFQSDLGKAQRMSDKFAKEVGRSLGNLAGVLVALGGAGGFGALVRGQINAADQAGKMAQKLGMAVEEFSTYAVAAKIANVEVETMAAGMRKLAQNQVEFAQGSGEASEAFIALGISQKQVADLNGDNAKLFELVTGKLAAFEDSTNKTALAIKIFGKSGAELIPLINELERTKKKAAELGLVVDKDTAEAADRFNDNMEEVGLVVQAFGRNIAVAVLPTLENLSQQFLEFTKDATAMAHAGEVANTGLKLLASGGTIVATIFKSMGQLIGGVGAALVLVAQGQYKQAFMAVREAGFDMGMTVRAAIASLEKTWDDTANSVNAKAEPNAKKLAAPAIKSLEQIKAAEKGIQAFRDALSQPLVQAAEEAQQTADDMVFTWTKFANTVESIDPIGAMASDGDVIDRLPQRVQMTTDEFKKLGEAQTEAMAKHVESAEIATQAAEGMISTWNSAGERVEMTIEAYEELEKQQKKNLDFVRSLGLTFTSAFEDAIVKGGQLRDILNGIAEDIARLLIRRTITEPFINAFGSAIGDVFGTNGPVQLSGPLPGKAIGGPVFGGMPYLVGENGPEIMVPSMSGTVIPNGGFGGISITNNLHADARTDQAYLELMMKRNSAQTIAAIRDMQNRTGNVRV